MTLDEPLFWLAALQLIWINILLSGDNAVVIALACRMLPPVQRRWGMVLGAGAAVLLRIVFTAALARFLTLPFLKLTGGCALLWIAVKLLLPEESDDGGHVEAPDNLWRAVWMVLVADVVMSLDNVLAIAAAAKGSNLLIIFGLAISIPLVVAGSAMIMALLDRYPWLVWAGAGLLGWIAGEIMADDSILQSWLAVDAHAFGYWPALAGAALVVTVALVLKARRRGEPGLSSEP